MNKSYLRLLAVVVSLFPSSLFAYEDETSFLFRDYASDDHYALIAFRETTPTQVQTDRARLLLRPIGTKTDHYVYPALYDVHGHNGSAPYQ
jgi:hypothetical protein